MVPRLSKSPPSRPGPAGLPRRVSIATVWSWRRGMRRAWDAPLVYSSRMMAWRWAGVGGWKQRSWVAGKGVWAGERRSWERCWERCCGVWACVLSCESEMCRLGKIGDVNSLLVLGLVEEVLLLLPLLLCWLPPDWWYAEWKKQRAPTYVSKKALVTCVG